MPPRRSTSSSFRSRRMWRAESGFSGFSERGGKIHMWISGFRHPPHSGRIRLFSNRRRRRRSRSRPRRSVRSLSAPTTAGPGSMPRFPAAGTPESTMPRSRISQRRASGSWLRRAEADMRRSQERPLRRPSSPEPRRFSWSGGS